MIFVDQRATPAFENAHSFGGQYHSEEIEHEEAIQRRADHWIPARSLGRVTDQGAVPSARVLQGQLLLLEQQVRRHDGP